MSMLLSKFPSSKSKLTTGRDCRWGKIKLGVLKTEGLPPAKRQAPGSGVSQSLPGAYAKSSLPVTAAGPSGVYFMGCVCTFQPGLAWDPEVHQICLTPTHGGRMVPRNNPVMIIREGFPHTTRKNKRSLSVMGRRRAWKGLGSLRLPQCRVSASEPSWNEWRNPCGNQETCIYQGSTLRLMAEQDAWSVGPSTFLIRKANWINHSQD